MTDKTSPISTDFYMFLTLTQNLMRDDKIYQGFDSGKFDFKFVLSEILYFGAFVFDHIAHDRFPQDQADQLMKEFMALLEKMNPNLRYEMWEWYKDRWDSRTDIEDLFQRAGMLDRSLTKDELGIISIGKSAAESSFGIVGSLNPLKARFFVPYVKLCWDACLEIIDFRQKGFSDERSQPWEKSLLEFPATRSHFELVFEPYLKAA